ncbi:site-2 protease family protein [Gemmata sp.]|uniref:site-2 protease family protein n=1 Tax=Gemmata sp. TaxID=1914242 RepID=UPI003F70D1FA
MSRWVVRALVVGLEFVLGMAVGLLLFMQVMVVGGFVGLQASLTVCLGGVAVLFASVALHEVGHLLAGLAAGVPPLRFVLGFLKIEWIGGSPRVRLNTEWNRAAAYVAFGTNLATRRAWFVIFAAGPLTNLVLGCGCLLAAQAWNPGPPTRVQAAGRPGWWSVAVLYPGDVPTALLNTAGLLNLAIGLASLVPRQVAGVRSDGGQLLDIWTGRR